VYRAGSSGRPEDEDGSVEPDEADLDGNADASDDEALLRLPCEFSVATLETVSGRAATAEAGDDEAE